MYDHARLFARLTAALGTDHGASLEQLARALRLHPHTVAQIVREQTGSSFSAWRARCRLAQACTLLRTRPDLSIKEVAAAAGFSSTSVFDRFMRRTCGRSPSEWRLVQPLDPPALSSGPPALCGSSPIRPAGQQAVVKVRRGTETGEAPTCGTPNAAAAFGTCGTRGPDTTTENPECLCGRSNAGSADAPPVECSQTFITGCQAAIVNVLAEGSTVDGRTAKAAVAHSNQSPRHRDPDVPLPGVSPHGASISRRKRCRKRRGSLWRSRAQPRSRSWCRRCRPTSGISTGLAVSAGARSKPT